MNIVIVGAGGQARDTEWLLRELTLHGHHGHGYECLGFVLSEMQHAGPNDAHGRILGDFSWLEENRSKVDGVVLGLANPGARVLLASELERRVPHLEWPTLIHPSVLLDTTSARIGRGAVIAAGVIGTVNVRLEDFALINVACTLGHEAAVGRGSVVNHAASISGNVTVGEAALIGTGARILERLSVGERAVVGAGAVVTRDVAPGTVVTGIPARPRTSGTTTKP